MASFIPNILVSKFQSAREYLTPVLTTSQFYEKGQLTPEEFVAAGEYLIRLSPTWKWGRGDPAYYDYFGDGSNCQFLSEIVTKL
jgi:hypothetical protein